MLCGEGLIGQCIAELHHHMGEATGIIVLFVPHLAAAAADMGQRRRHQRSLTLTALQQQAAAVALDNAAAGLRL